jgi:hypothetical protein
LPEPGAVAFVPTPVGVSVAIVTTLHPDGVAGGNTHLATRCARTRRSARPSRDPNLQQVGPSERIPEDSLAVAFAEAVATDHTAITDGLLEEFTVPQIVELLTWIVFEYAGQMFGALIGDEPATADERATFAAAVAGWPRPAS